MRSIRDHSGEADATATLEWWRHNAGKLILEMRRVAKALILRGGVVSGRVDD
jgi:hypothetical protein